MRRSHTLWYLQCGNIRKTINDVHGGIINDGDKAPEENRLSSTLATSS